VEQKYWKNKDPVFSEYTPIWFTDGSRVDSGTGSGVHGIRPNRSLSLPLGKFSTVFKQKYMPFFNAHVKT
jgi:hypothetical protein